MEWEYDGRPMCLVDTAGMRRWGSVRLATHGSLARLPGTDACRAVCFVQWDLSTPLEALSVEAARRALSKAHVVVLVIDATVGLTKQDLTIAQQVLEEGRALVVGLNKIDASEAPRMLHTMMEEALEEIAVDARGVECVSMSALTGSNVGALMPAVLDVYDKWNVRVPTSLLNRWLWRLSQVHPPPAARKTTVVTGSGRDKGRAAKSLRLKLKYLTQVRQQQVTAACDMSHTANHVLHRSTSDHQRLPCLPITRRCRSHTVGMLASTRSMCLPSTTPLTHPCCGASFLITALRTEFQLDGVPIRLVCRASHNPYNTRPSQGRADGRLQKSGSSRSKKK